MGSAALRSWEPFPTQYRENWHLPWGHVDLSLSEELVWLGDKIFNSFSLSCRSCFILHFNSTGRHVHACTVILEQTLCCCVWSCSTRPSFLSWSSPVALSGCRVSVSQRNGEYLCVPCALQTRERLTLGRSRADVFRQRKGLNSRASCTEVSFAVLPGLILPGSWAACHWVGNVVLVFQIP